MAAFGDKPDYPSYPHEKVVKRLANFALTGQQYPELRRDIRLQLGKFSDTCDFAVQCEKIIQNAGQELVALEREFNA